MDNRLSILQEEQLRRLQEEGLRYYKPYPKQEEFHRAAQPIKAFVAANQIGKTYAGAHEMLWSVARCHPYLENFTRPVRARECGTDFPMMSKSLIPLYQKLCPRQPTIINGLRWPGLKGYKWDTALTWNQSEHLLEFADGSEIDFVSYTQGIQSTAGVAKDIIRFDEDPKSEQFFNEQLARQNTTGVRMFFTLTPLQYSDWLYELLAVGEVTNPTKVKVVTAGMRDCPYITEAQIREVESKITDPAELAARVNGAWSFLAGRVWKSFGEHNIVDDFPQPRDWRKTVILDPHDEKPSFVMWIAQDDRSLKSYVYREAELQGDFREISDQIKNLCRGERIDSWLMDAKSGAQQAQLRGSKSKLTEFRRHLPFMLATPTSDVSRDLVRNMLANNPGSGPMLMITTACPITIAQTRNFSFKPPQKSGEERKFVELVRKNNEAPDCLQYYATFVSNDLMGTRTYPVKSTINGRFF